MKKLIIEIALVLLNVALFIFLIVYLLKPVYFNREKAFRSEKVIQRLKDVREAQILYKTVYNSYAGDFETLLNFLKNDSIPVVEAYGDVPDSLTEEQALKMGIITRQKKYLPARDEIVKKIVNPIDSIPYIPFAQGEMFSLQSDSIFISPSNFPVFEATAQNKQYLKGMNYKDRGLKSNDVIKVGSLKTLSLDGNWE